MPVRERVFNLLDPDTPFLEIAPFAAYGTDFTVGGGCVAGIGIIAGTECVIFANGSISFSWCDDGLCWRKMEQSNGNRSR